jgi:predicted carbohydrate-binding protein with CBM5 and CBM33 domain
MRNVSIKKLEKTSLDLAHAIVEVRSWSTVMATNLNNNYKAYNLCTLHEEAQKIEDFAKQLREAIEVKKLWVEQAEPQGISSFTITGGVI